MIPKLQYHFDRLEEIKTEVLQPVLPLAQSQLQSSATGKWSLGQVLIHIVASEQLALQYMRKKSLGVNELENAGLMEPMKLLLLKLSQRLPIKYKAPKTIVDNTPVFSSKEELLTSWKNNRKELYKFLETINEKDVDKKIFKHPIAGMFNVSQGLEFLREHIIHHKPQIKRLIMKSKSNL
jgi:uncharacterized damage-inducible protein DinB